VTNLGFSREVRYLVQAGSRTFAVGVEGSRGITTGIRLYSWSGTSFAEIPIPAGIRSATMFWFIGASGDTAFFVAQPSGEDTPSLYAFENDTFTRIESTGPGVSLYSFGAYGVVQGVPFFSAGLDDYGAGALFRLKKE
jgi:hypothetical protein